MKSIDSKANSGALEGRFGSEMRLVTTVTVWLPAIAFTKVTLPRIADAATIAN